MTDDQMSARPRTAEAPVLRVGGSERVVDATLIMGIVNASPESFSDGGLRRDAAEHVRLAGDLIDAGADIIDVGGQSAVTNRPEIDTETERARVLPVVSALTREHPGTLISVDTYRPAVARACLEAGALIINDVSGLIHPELATMCAEYGAALVVMHTAAPPKTRLQRPELYRDVVAEVVDFLDARIARAVAAGLPLESVVVDPGVDFAKTPHQSLQLLRDVGRIRALGRPVLLALSRKDFLGAIVGKRPRGRDASTLAAIAHVAGGVRGTIVRVHDVAATRDVLRTIDALSGRLDIPEGYVLPDDLRYET